MTYLTRYQRALAEVSLDEARVGLSQVISRELREHPYAYGAMIISAGVGLGEVLDRIARGDYTAALSITAMYAFMATGLYNACLEEAKSFAAIRRVNAGGEDAE